MKVTTALSFAAFYIVLLVFPAVPASVAMACEPGAACVIEGADGGTYHVAKSDSVNDGAIDRAFVFFHGHNGSGAGVMKNKGLAKALTQAGYLLIAPDGPQFSFRGRTTRGWAARSEGVSPRGGRDDVRFVERVLEHAAARFGLDLKKTVVAGFSSGGSMAWYFSCYSVSPLAGVVAVAGGLRRPLPPVGAVSGDDAGSRKCPAGPRKVVHIHGFSDRQVPLEGLGIRDWHQGDVFEGLSIQRASNQCRSRPDKVSTEGGYWCREWNQCTSGKPVRLCLHAGGHGMPKNWLKEGLGWLN